MGTASQKYAELIEGLFEKTASGKMKWTSETFNIPSVQIGDAFVTIQQTRNSRNQPVIQVQIYNSRFDEVDKFSDDDLPEHPDIEGYESYWTLMLELNKMALRSASGADKIIDSLIEKLKFDD